jgi:hypothetical protein
VEQDLEIATVALPVAIVVQKTQSADAQSMAKRSWTQLVADYGARHYQ